MKMNIFYFTGTGNSLWAARTIAKEFPGATLISIRHDTVIPEGAADVTGIIFPVYAWAPPLMVQKFAARLDYSKAGYVFSVALNAGGVAGTNTIFRKILGKHNGVLSAGFSLPLVSNYIVMGNIPSREEQDRLIDEGLEKLKKIVAAVKSRETGIVETKGGAVKRFLLSGINRAFISHMNKSDSKYITDENCNGCGVCAKVCPAGNITIESGRPVWHHKCEQCLACMHWCPKASINMGNATKKKGRYHHPNVTLKDMTRE